MIRGLEQRWNMGHCAGMDNRTVPLFDLVNAKLTPAADMRRKGPTFDLKRQGAALEQDPRKERASKE